MKKCRFSIVFIAVLFLFCDCQTYYEYAFEQSLDQVDQVYIVSEEDGVEVQRECDIEILEEIRALPCQKYWNDPPHKILPPYIFIEYNNGAIEKISASSNYYEIEETWDYDWEYFDSDAFLEILQKYQVRSGE